MRPSNETEHIIVQLWLDGALAKQIAHDFKLPAAVITYILKKHGASFELRKKRIERKFRIKELWLAGKTQAEIARDLNLSVSTIKNDMREAGLLLQPGKPKRYFKNKEQQPKKSSLELNET